MTNKIATLIFIIAHVLVLSVSAFLITIENNTGTMIAGVAGLILCTVSSWVFRIWTTTRTETKKQIDETVGLSFMDICYRPHNLFCFCSILRAREKNSPFYEERRK